MLQVEPIVESHLLRAFQSLPLPGHHGGVLRGSVSVDHRLWVAAGVCAENRPVMCVDRLSWQRLDMSDCRLSGVPFSLGLWTGNSVGFGYRFFGLHFGLYFGPVRMDLDCILDLFVCGGK
ncbi:unnamed protein product [Cuscuta epithymum]|uniref:Uncharacterized protein n=1 Tax=Cuscuta epithymum TaxID=186058 RepID=A0AAV0DM36_9ASTE|nr:unnamed protein product [Cuscuta epithymum]